MQDFQEDLKKKMSTIDFQGLPFPFNMLDKHWEIHFYENSFTSGILSRYKILNLDLELETIAIIPMVINYKKGKRKSSLNIHIGRLFIDFNK